MNWNKVGFDSVPISEMRCFVMKISLAYLYLISLNTFQWDYINVHKVETQLT